MPKGPNGEKRPADAVGLAVLIGRIATGEVEDAQKSIGGREGVTNPEPVSKPKLLLRRRLQKSS